MKKARKLEDWEKDFIYLAYPLSRIKDISQMLNISRHRVRNYSTYYKNKVRKILPGMRFHKLITIKIHQKYEKHNTWECKCDCGNIVIVRSGYLLSNKTSSCGCHKIEKLKTSYGYITGTWYGRFLIGAKYRNIEFNVSQQFLNDLLIKQNFKCALSGLPINIEQGNKRDKEYFIKTTASLDRIDSSKNYTEDNVQFVHKDINQMKLDYNQDYFIEMCKMVAEYAKSSKSNNKSNTE